MTEETIDTTDIDALLDSTLDDLEDLPEWLKNIARDSGYYEQIRQIDNIWFMQEEGNFLIPTVVFEHERSRNYRAILDRFNALKEVLNKNLRFKNIKPYPKETLVEMSNIGKKFVKRCEVR